MSAVVAVGRVTLRGLLGRRRTLLVGLLALLPVAIALLIRLAGGRSDIVPILDTLVVRTTLPLVALILGTAAIGSEIEDGTIVYLLAKPVPRLTIVIVKLLVAWLVTSIIVVPGIWIAGVVATGGSLEIGTAYAVAAIVAGLEYTAIFLALSLVTSRALVVGLAYVVVWEGVVAGLFAGTRLLSVRQHALWVADAIGGEGVVPSDLGPQARLVLVVITAGAFVIALRRLERVELRGETG